MYLFTRRYQLTEKEVERKTVFEDKPKLNLGQRDLTVAADQLER